MHRYKYLAVDFDDTLCYRINLRGKPIGPVRQEIVDLVEELRSRGWKIILWTCRSGDSLKEALAWCEEQNIKFDFVNENPEAIKWFHDKCGVTQESWSPKVFADLYIDDSAFNHLKLFRDLHNKDFSCCKDIAKAIEMICHERSIEKS